jgi:hypothetical protein
MSDTKFYSYKDFPVIDPQRKTEAERIEFLNDLNKMIDNMKGEEKAMKFSVEVSYTISGYIEIEAPDLDKATTEATRIKENHLLDVADIFDEEVDIEVDLNSIEVMEDDE